ncbi:MAG: 4-hydroxy-tetrahydrodipicolinate reductase [Candidatus Fimenecus sp.]
MTRIILSGCLGHMGQVITDCVRRREDCEIVAGVDIGEGTADYPVFKSFADLTVDGDVIIDFSHPSVLDGLLAYATAHKCAAVVATTGLSDEQIAKLREAAKEIPLFFSANMSIGVSLIAELAAKAARVLEGAFDIEIVEMHHNQKIDAPSGTALMLADTISDALTEKPHYEFDRHSKRAKRDPHEIGIHAVRGGTIVGEHEIIFAGLDEVIKISHSARSKNLFAVGAVNAAVFLKDKPAKLYSMKDLVDNK